MRALFTLIKRQVVDNVVYFAVAIVASVILIIAVITFALTYDFQTMSLNKLIQLIWLPVYMAVGFCVLGVIQSYRDRKKGISELLLTLPVKHNQILLAQVLNGMFLILIVLVPGTVTGIILCRLLLPPAPFFLGWLADMFIGGFMAVLGCYCLGLHAGAKAQTFTLALVVALFAPLVLLLIVIKGLGWPLVVILLLFIAFSLLHCMRSFGGSYVTSIATGFIVLVLLSVSLFCGRYSCDVFLLIKTRFEKRNLEISPSGLLSPEIENDPNVITQSVGSGNIKWYVTRVFQRYEKVGWFLEQLGIIDYFSAVAHGGHPPRIGFRDGNCLYFDKTKGQLVYLDADRQLFAGPKGISSTPDANLGQFKSPIFWTQDPWWCEAYDKHVRSFFFINFDKRTIRRSAEVEFPTYEPLDIDGSTVKSEILDVDWDPPYKGSPSNRMYPRYPAIRYNLFKACLPVVDESGLIHLLSKETLKLSEPVAHLPRPRTLFGWGSRKPRDLSAYDVYLISTTVKAEYAGIVVGSLSRQGTFMTLAVFDKDGKKIKSANSKSTFFDAPGGPALTITKYIFESLHPPVLTLASFFTAYSFEARSTHRALFLMPNSFVAMARDYEGNIFYMLLLVLLLMLPGILFAGLLGWRVTRDAAIIGLSHNARRLWLAGTLVFGLPAYITYRLTRSKITLVTCANCCKPRRTDMDICHRCGSKWDVPELIPPSWRVLNRAEQILDNSFTEEAAGE